MRCNYIAGGKLVLSLLVDGSAECSNLFHDSMMKFFTSNEVQWTSRFDSVNVMPG